MWVALLQNGSLGVDGGEENSLDGEGSGITSLLGAATVGVLALSVLLAVFEGLGRRADGAKRRRFIGLA